MKSTGKIPLCQREMNRVTEHRTRRTASHCSPLGCGYKRIRDALHIGLGHLLGSWELIRPRNSRRPINYERDTSTNNETGAAVRELGMRSVPLSGHPPSLAKAVAVLARCVRSALDLTHGASVDALRLACPSWTPILAPCVCAKSTIRLRGAICVSVQSPASSGEMRPSGTTAVASMTMPPAPRVAKPCAPDTIPKERVSSARGIYLWASEERLRTPMWTKCQSVAWPLSELYWHIGD